VKIEIETEDGRILARIINLASRLGCKLLACELAQGEERATITASFSGDDHQLRRLGGQLSRLISDERAQARFCTT
jgi:hypothetical protein